MHTKKLVIFDFDGVLVNTVDLAFSINKKSNAGLTFDQYKDMHTGNFYEKMEKAKKNFGFVEPENFFEQYEEGINKIPSEEALIKEIKGIFEIYTLAIVSSTTTNAILSFLEKEGIKECFSDVLGCDFHKSKVVKIKHLLEKYNCDPKDSVFITDTIGDVLEARECGLDAIAVPWGYHSREYLAQSNPKVILENPADLAKVLESIL